MRLLFTCLVSPIKTPPLLKPFSLSPLSLSSAPYQPTFSLFLSLHHNCSGSITFSAMAAPPPLPPPRSTTPPIATATSIEVGVSRRLWNKFKRESIFSLFSPFVLSLASGNLRLETFRHYISQDVHFLKAFELAYELAEKCADDDEGKIAISELRKGVLEELKLHDSFVQYTNFLLATASGKVEGVKGLGKLATPFEKTRIAAYTLGAMTPCMKLYTFLGKELQALFNPEGNSHPYKRWVDHYSSELLQAFTLQIEDVLDKLSVSLTGEELDVIERLYQQAMKLGVEFFLAQPLVQPTVFPLFTKLNPAEWRLMLFSDFDLTCTVVDSSAILAEIAIVKAPKCDQDSSEKQIAHMSSADLRNTWGILSRQYTEEYEQCIENVLSTTKEGEFSYETLHKSLELLSDFEKKANAKVISSGVLRGINLEDIKRAGERIILQDGCTSFFQKVVHCENLHVNVHILSYCWCGDLIRSAFSSGGLQALKVHANEFNYEGSISTGKIDKKVESPIEKVQAFSEILMNSGNDRKNINAYIGDSIGDLLCLLKADIGIVMGSSSSLRRVGNHFGVSFVPLFQGLVRKQMEWPVEGSSFNWKAQPGVLYTASSWAEIHAFILGA